MFQRLILTLDGIAISGYRSFGDKLVKINDLQKINIFIGKNNSGKSNVLRFFKHLSEINNPPPLRHTAAGYHQMSFRNSALAK